MELGGGRCSARPVACSLACCCGSLLLCVVDCVRFVPWAHPRPSVAATPPHPSLCTHTKPYPPIPMWSTHCPLPSRAHAMAGLGCLHCAPRLQAPVVAVTFQALRDWTPSRSASPRTSGTLTVVVVLGYTCNHSTGVPSSVLVNRLRRGMWAAQTLDAGGSSASHSHSLSTGLLRALGALHWHGCLSLYAARAHTHDAPQPSLSQPPTPPFYPCWNADVVVFSGGRDPRLPATLPTEADIMAQ